MKFLAAVILLLEYLTSFAAYSPPIGIPAPNFGITDAPIYPVNWTNTVVGAYYIDNLSPNAIDGTNTFGNPLKPRLTIPNGASYNYEAGAIVVVTNGPYSPSSSTFTISFVNGSSGQPIYFMGFGTNGLSATKAKILDREWQIKGSFFVIDGFYVQGTTKRSKIRVVTGQGTNTHDYAIRNCEITDPGATTGSALSGNGSNVVLYANYCHHNGDYQSTASADVHSVQVPDASHNVWILDNDLGFSAGDSVQVNATQSFIDLPGPVYIGRNRLHDNKENAVDLKTCHDVIVSENDCYNFPVIQGLGGTGEAFAINDENQPNTGDHNLWVILNKIHDAGQSSLRHQSWCHSYGNLCYNITNAFGGTANGMNSWGTFTDQFENNTIYNVNRGVYIFDGSTGARHELRNNIIANNIGPESFRLENVGATNSVLANCLFPAVPGNMIWGSTTYTTVASMQTAQSAYATNNLSATPTFTNPTAAVFTLGQGSTGIDQGTVPTAPALFLSRYGISIAFDINHVARPQNGTWDIGAFEYQTGQPLFPVVAIRGKAAVNGRTTMR